MIFVVDSVTFNKIECLYSIEALCIGEVLYGFICCDAPIFICYNTTISN